MPTSGKDMVREMKKAGWRIDRIEGSHYIMIKDRQAISVPVHGNKDLKQGIETWIRKSTGLKK